MPVLKGLVPTQSLLRSMSLRRLSKQALAKGSEKSKGPKYLGGNLTGESHTELRNDLFKPITIRAETAEKAVGNEAGYEIFSTLKRLELKTQELQKSEREAWKYIRYLQEDVQELQERVLPLRLIRAKILDRIVGYTGGESGNLSQDKRVNTLESPQLPRT
ncbi:hypothetical protein BJX63DRAFT_386253 [Aspergillus granulosus]|uniref:Uncharacterized protein n=1 Tax=Aspergillus granulosus TaxID=176169 RepID=A0ABR4HNU3_9EURO